MAENFKRWDIVKVPFPFTEGAGEKRRPALVVSGPKLAQTHHFYWLAMVTSVIKPLWAGDVMIDDFAKAGLPVRSIVRTAKVTTLQADRILGYLGQLATSDAKLVAREIKLWFDE